MKLIKLKGKGDFCMEFCPTCGCFLAPAKSKVGDETVIVLACSKCGYRKQASGKAMQLRTGKVIHRKAKPAVTVISDEDQKIQTMPTIKVECPKCGNNLVFVWQVQTRGGDEASTQFMRCTKCGHTFREYT
jgi:transcription factor S